MWNRRDKGRPTITLEGGYKRKFRTNELYNAAWEAISRSRFENPLHLREFVSKLINGYEVDTTTIPMGQDLSLPNGIFLPAKTPIAGWDD